VNSPLPRITNSQRPPLDDMTRVTTLKGSGLSLTPVRWFPLTPIPSSGATGPARQARLCGCFSSPQRHREHRDFRCNKIAGHQRIRHRLKQTWTALSGKMSWFIFSILGSPFAPMFHHWDPRSAGVLSHAKCLPLCSLCLCGETILKELSRTLCHVEGEPRSVRDRHAREYQHNPFRSKT